MIQYFFLFTCLFSVVLAKAQPLAPLQIASEISKVTVYRQGALVTRGGTITLEAGQHEIVFDRLEQSVRAEGIQLAIDPTVGTFSLEYARVSAPASMEQDSVRALRAELEEQQLDLAGLGARRAGLKEELAVLAANRDLTSKAATNPRSPQEVAAAAKLFREQTTDVHLALAKLKVEERKLKEEISKIERRINAALPGARQDIGQIRASVVADRAGTFAFELSYLVSSVSWTPDYDLYVQTEGEADSRLVLTGNITQYTGVDWKDVDLTLSTSNINTRLAAPELGVMVLGQPRMLRSQVAGRAMSKRAEADTYAEEEIVQMEPLMLNSSAAAPTVATFAQQSNSAAARLYRISRPFSLATNGKSAAVKLTSVDLPLDLRYSVVPKREPVAYLEGLITNWDTLNLIAAQTRMHLDGRYLGKTFLNTAEKNDTLTVGLGPDPRIVVERKGIGQGSDVKVIRGKKEYDLGYRITLRNTRKVAVDILVLDQIPISQREEIEVTVKDMTGRPKQDKLTGLLTWELSLKPATNEVLDVKYEVVAPKSVAIGFE